MGDDTPNGATGESGKTTVVPIQRQFEDFAFFDIPQAPPSFAEVRLLFARLSGMSIDSQTSSTLNLFGEGELRLEQLAWITQRVVALQNAPGFADQVLRYRDHRGESLYSQD